jgi:hypothetical protein
MGRKIILILFVASITTLGALAAIAATSSKTARPTGSSPVTRAVVFNTTVTDYGDMNIVSEPIYGFVERVVAEATGTETDFTLTLTDCHDVNLWSKTDCNSLAMPYSNAVTMADLADANQYAVGVPVMGAMKLHIADVNYAPEIQTLAVDGNATVGTFTLSYGGEETSGIAYDANAAEVQTALEALTAVDTNDIIVAGGTIDAGTSFTFTFASDLGDVALIVPDFTECGVTSEVQTLTRNTAIAGTFTLSYGGVSTADIAFDATTGEIDTALHLSTLDGNNVTVGGTALDSAGTTTFTYAAKLGDVDMLTIDTSNLGKTAEVQTMVGDNATAGTFTLTYEGETTAAIAYDASKAAIKTALELLSTVASDDISVGGTAVGTTGNTTFTFRSNFGNVSLITIDTSNLGKTAEVQTLAGDTATSGTYTLTYGGQTTTALDYDASTTDMSNALVALTNVSAGDITVGGDDLASGSDTTFTFRANFGDVSAISIDTSNLGKTSEVQTLVLDNVATAGTFTLSYNFETTAAIAYDANTAEIQAALEALSTVDTGDITVGGYDLANAGNTTFTFLSKFGPTRLMGIDISSLTGPTTATISETTAGAKATEAVTETTKGVLDTQTISETTAGALVSGTFAETTKGVAETGDITTTTPVTPDLSDITVTVYYLGD